MPQPRDTLNLYNESELIRQEMFFNLNELKIKSEEIIKKLNHDQSNAFQKIFSRIDNHDSGKNIFFIDGPGGTGKTFLYSALLNFIRANGNIALAVASSGIAALILQNGRTVHSRFKIPINLDDLSTCNIPVNSDLAELIRLTKFVIWDEAPMMNRYAFEALDRSFRDILKVEKPFGGKVIVFGGDFRQI